MNTPEGRKKGVDTMRDLYGPGIYAKIGALGGKNSPNRPMRDTKYAARLANIRWTKYRFEKGQLTQQEFDEIMSTLTSDVNTSSL